MRIQYDILWSLDNNVSVLLVSLDLSAAFDIINHDIRLYCLEIVFGIIGTCLNWFRSYLTGRRLRVVIDGTASDIRHRQKFRTRDITRGYKINKIKMCN